MNRVHAELEDKVIQRDNGDDVDVDVDVEDLPRKRMRDYKEIVTKEYEYKLLGTKGRGHKIDDMVI